MKTRNLFAPLRLVAMATAVLLALAGCSGSGDAGKAADKTVNFGVIQGWTDETATTALLQVVLESKGYTVKVTEISDNAPMYTGLSKGDIDVLSSSWLERTHKDYWARFGKDIADLGVYYNDAQNYLAVPTYSDITSIDQLEGKASEYGNQIIGIEPGAGLTATTKNSVIPGYGLSDYKLVTSSTAAMLTELKKRTEAKAPIVVTLWKPFWANQSFPVRPLEDPKNAFGGSEKLHVVASKKFAESHPEVAKMLGTFKLDDKQYGTLEDTVVNKFPKGQETEAAKAWLKDNAAVGDALAAQLSAS